MHALTDALINFLSGHGSGAVYAIVFLVLFSETGLLVGFFLPGDSLLIALGVLAPKTHWSLWLLVLFAAAGAIIGNEVGYSIGNFAGPKLLEGPRTRRLRPYVDEAHQYFERFGKSALIITRFTPVIRTFVPTLAGIGRMDRKTFTACNVIGATIWSVTIIIGGYLLSRKVPQITQHITAIEAVILVGSLIVAWRHLSTLLRAGHE